MLLFHVTPAWNRASITQHGLLTACAEQRAQVVWLVTQEWITWAIRHTANRHGCRIIDTDVWLVGERHRPLAHLFRSGRWFVRTDVPADAITLYIRADRRRGKWKIR